MKIKLILDVFLLFIIFSVFTSPVFAQTPPTIGANLGAYVPPTGTECNINVPSQYSTIQAAINAANSGDTICVGSGVYNENLRIDEKAIRLSGSGAEQSVLNSYIYTRGGNFIIEGFLIRGLPGYLSAVDISHDDGYGVIIRYNWIEAANGSRALMAAGTHYLFQNNVFEGNNSPTLASVGEGEQNNFLNNTFVGTTSNGVVLGDTSNSNIIQNNIFKTTGSISLGVIFVSWSSLVNENNIYSDARYKVYNYPDLGILNAENNWWGVSDPGGQYITVDVDYIPFVSTAFPEYPLPAVPPQSNAGRDQIANVGDTVNFDGSLSVGHVGGPEIVGYNWDFGDGTTGSEIATTHTYTANGLYSVTLTIVDSAGLSDSDSMIVRIVEPLEYQTASFYDFNDGSTVGWAFECSVAGCGNWRVENGILVQDSGRDGVSATIADRQFSDQVIETDLMLNGISGNGGVQFWVQGHYDSAVTVGLYAGKIWITEYANGVETSRSVPYSYHYGTWYHLKVVANNISGIVDVYINGEYLLSYATTLPNRVGKTGVIWGNAGGSIDNFKVSIPLVLNQPPVANAGNDQTSNEGSSVSFDGSLSTDPDGLGDIVSYDWDFGDGAITSGQIVSHTYADNGNYIATLMITDSAGQSDSDIAEITVNNVVPTVGIITAPTDPVQINISITASANFTDPGSQDTHIASWDWGDGNTTTGTVMESGGSVSDDHVYTTAGVYTIVLTVTDKDGGAETSTFQYVSVYSPTPQGLFSGARIFDSPAGAYLQNPSLTGKVMFGVSVKYQDTIPAGNVSMDFKIANFDFVGTYISSLVTSNGKATLRGSGTLNGASGYTFLVTGIDSSQTGGQTVRFQIKDSDVVVYDSQPGASDTADPTTPVTGQIIVH